MLVNTIFEIIGSKPGIVTCIDCLGWGTLLKGDVTIGYYNNSSGITFKTVPCDKCSGTGKRPIPYSELS